MALVDITFLNETVEAGFGLKGSVEVKVDKTIKVKVVELCLKGDAWTNLSDSSRTKERLLKKKIVLYHGKGSTEDSSTTYLCQGLHKFPFECYIPHGLPPTFHGLNSSIDYSAKIRLKKSWGDHIRSKPFFVHTTMDLNSNQSLRLPVLGLNEILLSSLCCKKGLLSATFRLDRQGYVPGEEIRPKVEIRNDSPRKIEKLHVQLKQVEEGGRKKTVASTTRDGLSSHFNDVWLDGRLEVPPLTPSFLHGCSTITLKYVVQLVVVPEGVGGKLKIPLNVEIGTVPLMQQPQIDLAPECYNGQASVQDSTDEHTQGVRYSSAANVEFIASDLPDVGEI